MEKELCEWVTEWITRDFFYQIAVAPPELEKILVQMPVLCRKKWTNYVFLLFITNTGANLPGGATFQEQLFISHLL